VKPKSVTLWNAAGNTGMLWLATAIAAMAWWPIYADVHFVILVSATMIVGSAIAILGAVFRWSTAIVTLAGFAAFVILGVPLAVPNSALLGVFPSVDGLVQLFAGVALSWKQLITITVPVANYQALLVPPFILCLIVGIAGLSLALRSRRGDLSPLAPVAFFIAGIGFGPKIAPWPVAVTLSLLGVVLVWLMWRRWDRRRAAVRLIAGTNRSPSVLGFRTVLSAFLVIVFAGATAVGASAALPPAGTRDVLRTVVEQPFDPRDYVSPLVGFRHYLQNEDAKALMFSVKGLPSNGLIRIATLDSYDGIVYSLGSSEVSSASGAFTRVPQRFDQAGVHGRQISVEVTVEKYTGVWLPTIGQLESVDFVGAKAAQLRDSFYYNDNAGTAAVIGGLASGDQYTLAAIIPTQPTASQLSELSPGSAQLPSLGVLPADLRDVLDSYTSTVQGKGNKLAAMLAGLRTNGYVSHGLSSAEPPSRSGHSADRITQLLSDQRMIGDAEQYSVTAALMARELGFPARVVFGFAPHNDSTGTTQVTGDMVSAWIEVNTSKYGWVTIDPTPAVRQIPEELPEQPHIVSRPQTIIPPPVQEPANQNLQPPAEASQNTNDQLAPWLVVLLAVVRVFSWVALIVGLAVSPFLLIIAAKVRRRQLRRKAPTPIQRISGGWSEFHDSVLDHGFTPPAAATRNEIAATVGGEAPMALATVADRAIFSPLYPEPEVADDVWLSVAELEKSFDADRTRWQRIRAMISVRSLGGNGVRSFFKR
jgi:TgpA N-terminal domain/Transglutaminase-like superfamily